MSKLPSRGLTALAAGVFFIFNGAVQAQQILQRSAQPFLRVHGEATISVSPDQAQVDIGVVSQGNSADTASSQNNSRANALVQALRARFPEASIKSIDVSVNPIYRYPRGGPPVIAGYTASNTVRLLLSDLSKLPEAIGIAIKSGANSINRLDFTLRDETPVRAKALAEAARQAQAGAKALAASLKLKLGPLWSVEEGQPIIVSPPREISFEKLRSANLAPISPGTIDVHADLNLTYEIVQPAERPCAQSPAGVKSLR